MQHDDAESEATLVSNDGTPLDAEVVKAIHLSVQYLLCREEHGDLYLKPGSAEEREARTALAWLLEHLARTAGAPALGGICRLLADLFNPQSGETRELTLRHRPHGRETWRAKKIAGDVVDMVALGRPRDAAIQEAAERHGVDRATAYRAWKAHKEQAAALRALVLRSRKKDP